MPREFWIDTNTRITDRNDSDSAGNGTSIKITAADAADGAGRSFTADLIEVSGSATTTTPMIGRYDNPGANDKIVALKLVDKKLEIHVKIVFRIHPTRPERDRIIIKRVTFDDALVTVKRDRFDVDPDVESFVRNGVQETQAVVPGPPRKFTFSTAVQPGTVSVRNNGSRVAYDNNGQLRSITDSSPIGSVNYATGVITIDPGFGDPLSHAEAFLI